MGAQAARTVLTPEFPQSRLLKPVQGFCPRLRSTSHQVLSGSGAAGRQRRLGRIGSLERVGHRPPLLGQPIAVWSGMLAGTPRSLSLATQTLLPSPTCCGRESHTICVPRLARKVSPIVNLEIVVSRGSSFGCLLQFDRMYNLFTLLELDLKRGDQATFELIRKSTFM